MKSKLLLASIFLAFSAQGQITITGASMNTWTPGADTATEITNFSLGNLVNGTFDLSTATYDPNWGRFDEAAATSPSFPAAAYKRWQKYATGAVIKYGVYVFWNKDNNALTYYGEQIPRQAIALGSLTGNTSDSLVFPVQTNAYSTPQKLLAFPMTMGTNWSGSWNQFANFNLTVAAFGLNNVPGQRRSQFTESDTVKGWGKLRMRDHGGNLSGYMNVLVVQTKTIVIDSFYLGGAPAPGSVLTAFGLTQGMRSVRYTTQMYRSGEVWPALYVGYNDSTRTTVERAIVTQSRLAPLPTGVGSITTTSYDVYPNPINGRTFYVSGLDKDAPVQYIISSVNGQCVQSGTLNGTTKEQVTLSERIPAGTYLLTISRQGNPVSHTMLVLP